MPIWQPTQSLSRPAYYDRQQSSVFATCDVLVGQHGATVRASYTAPANRAGFIETIWMLMLRVGSPSVADNFTIWADYLPPAGVVANIQQLVASLSGTYSVGPVSTTQFGYIPAGGRIRLLTEDDSTGGNTFYRGTVKGIEFTA